MLKPFRMLKLESSHSLHLFLVWNRVLKGAFSPHPNPATPTVLKRKMNGWRGIRSLLAPRGGGRAYKIRFGMLFPPGPLSTAEGRGGNSIQKLILYAISPRPSQYALWRISGRVNARPCRLAGLSGLSGWPGPVSRGQIPAPRPRGLCKLWHLLSQTWVCLLYSLVFPPWPRAV